MSLFFPAANQTSRVDNNATWRTKTKVRLTHIFIKKDKITGMVDILWSILEKCKKVQNEVTGLENVVFGKFN